MSEFEREKKTQRDKLRFTRLLYRPKNEWNSVRYFICGSNNDRLDFMSYAQKSTVQMPALSFASPSLQSDILFWLANWQVKTSYHYPIKIHSP